MISSTNKTKEDGGGDSLTFKEWINYTRPIDRKTEIKIESIGNDGIIEFVFTKEVQALPSNYKE